MAVELPQRVLIDVDFASMPSLTYGIDIRAGRISGKVDGHDAMEQAVWKVLNTERYRYLAYTWNYGVELEDLFGQAIPYVCPEVERRVKEALLWDDRITDVSDFDFDLSVRNVVQASFTVYTIFGNVEIEKFHVIEPPRDRVVNNSVYLLSGARFSINSRGELVYDRPEALDEMVTFRLDEKNITASETDVFADQVRLALNENYELEATYV